MKSVEQEFLDFETQGGFAAWITERHPDSARRTGSAPKVDCPEMHSFSDSSSSMPRGLLQVYLNNRLLSTREEEALSIFETQDPPDTSEDAFDHPVDPAPLAVLLDVYLEDVAVRASPTLALPARFLLEVKHPHDNDPDPSLSPLQESSAGPLMATKN